MGGVGKEMRDQMSQVSRCFTALAAGFVCALLVMAAAVPEFGYFEFGGRHVSGVWHAQLLAETSIGAFAIIVASTTFAFARFRRAHLYIGLALPPSAYLALYASLKLTFAISQGTSFFAVRFAATVGLAALTVVALSIAAVVMRRAPSLSPPN